MNQLRHSRLSRGFTQAELAYRAKVSVRTVHATENNKSTPRFEIQRRLLKVLDIPWTQREVIFPMEETHHAANQVSIEGSLQGEPQS